MERDLKVGFLKQLRAIWFISLCTALFMGGVAHAAPQYPFTCSSCHGMPPLDDPAARVPATGAFKGNHQNHLPSSIVINNSGSYCLPCHNSASYNTSHRTGQIGLQANINSSPAIGKYMINAAQVTFKNQTSNPVLGTCATVNCHFENPTTLTWGSPAYSSTADCSSCHSVPGTSNPHSKHDAYYTFAENSCLRCHPDYITDLKFSHATSVGNRGISVILDDGSYTGNGLNYLPSQSGRTFGSCNSIYCHSNGKNGPPNVTPVWGGSISLTCSGCHGDANSTGSQALYGRHDRHVNNAVYLGTNFNCAECHAQSVINNSTIRNKKAHVNSFIEYSGAKAGQNFADCSNIYCHSDGKGTHVNPGSWDAAALPTPGCKLCHGNSTVAQGAEFESIAGEPNYVNGGIGQPKANSHRLHTLTGSSSCVSCHSTTTTTGTAIKPASTVHIDGGITVVKGGTADFVYIQSTKTCSASSCHSGGGIVVASADARWGDAFTCTSCHGNAVGGSLSPKHAAHVNNATVIGTNYTCVDCHAKTVSDDTTINTPAKHLNSFVDYSGAKAGKSTTYTTADGVCSASYCHSDGKGVQKSMTATNWKSASTLDCKGCHGSDAAPDFTSSSAGEPNYVSIAGKENSHKKHAAKGATSCVQCHSATTVTGAAIVTGSTTHIDRQFTVSSTGNITVTYNNQTKTCSATYCHSNVQAPGGIGAPSSFSSPVWGANNTLNCGSCHVNMSTLAEDATGLSYGSHKRHATDSGLSCSVCHGTGFTPTTTSPVHGDGTINLAFTDKGKGTTYSQPLDNVPGNGYGTCSTSKCHGRATRNWGINTTLPTCEKCHGSANTAITSGVFKDTAGSTGSAYVGTHVSHLSGIHNISSRLTCDQCHTVPATVNSFGHMTSLPAPITWGAIATKNRLFDGAPGASMVPSYDYSTKTCSNTYCHAGVRNGTAANDLGAQGSGASPVWGDPAYLGGSGCGKCHSYPPAYPHPQSNVCSACHNNVAASQITFLDKTKHIDGTLQVTVDDCLGCHSGINTCQAGDPTCVYMPLFGAHKNHTDADLFLYNEDGTKKKLSAGDYTDISWIYTIKYKKGFPKYGCGFCHPMDAGTHKNGIVELDMDPAHSEAGTVKNKNKVGGPWSTVTSGSSVVCNNVYCHSNGFVVPATNSYAYQQTPDWYANNPWAAVDKCSQCHGNSPNVGTAGSPAHGGHVVANHYNDVYSNYSGKLAVAATVASGIKSVHGNPATSTTFNCNLCHFDTVKVSYNDKGSVCVSCHVTAGSAPLKGTMDVYSSNTNHVDGNVDVVFQAPFVIKSKAQLRDDITSVTQLNASWTRVKGYKTYSSHDISNTTPNFTAGTCSTVACHNGTPMEWRTQGPLQCAACHIGLPR